MKNISFLKSFLAGLTVGSLALSSHAATIIEGHSTGLLFENFQIEEGETVSTSGPSTAVGLEGDHSLFPDEGDTSIWNFVFTPGVDPDNFTPEAGTLLAQSTYGNGEVASGLTQADLPDGGTGDYRVFVTWPWTGNVTNPTTFSITDPDDTVL